MERARSLTQAMRLFGHLPSEGYDLPLSCSQTASRVRDSRAARLTAARRHTLSHKTQSCLFACALWISPLSTHATPAPATTRTDADLKQAERASQEFELGVQHFEDGQYEAAARAFLRADVLAPNSDALSNALVAAERALAHLLVAEVAAQALQRTSTDPGLVAQARHALSEAARHLAQVRLTCSPDPCEVSIDGHVTPSGLHYLNPGNHRFSATSTQPNTERPVRVLSLNAGAEYEVSLDVKKSSPQALTTPRPSTSPRDSRGDAAPHQKVVLYSGITVTAVLAGLTTWSGIDTMNYRNSLGERAPQSELDAAQEKILRTDVLLGSSIAFGLFTAAWALFGMEGPENGPRLEASFLPGGAFIGARGVLP